MLQQIKHDIRISDKGQIYPKQFMFDQFNLVEDFYCIKTINNWSNLSLMKFLNHRKNHWVTLCPSSHFVFNKYLYILYFYILKIYIMIFFADRKISYRIFLTNY